MPYVTQSQPTRGVALPPYRYWYESTTYAAGPGTENLIGSQTTYSWRTAKNNSAEDEYNNMTGPELRREVNREYRDRFDNGHPFWTQKDFFSWSNPAISVDGSNGVHYVGCLGVVKPADDRPQYTLPSSTKIMVDGTEGVRRTYPTRPEAGLATALGELRQEVPHLPGALLANLTHRFTHPRRNLRSVGGETGRTVLPFKAGGSARPMNPKEISGVLGDEYLNLVFGVQPTANDLEKIARAVLRSVQSAKQMQRDSGRIVRRRANLYDTSTSVSKSDTGISVSLGLISGTYRPSAFLRSYDYPASVVDSVRQRAWFSGAYQYHLAEAHSFLGKMDRYEQLANHLLGTRITPETIWELTPWSWLIDWFSDTGSFVSNVSALHNDDLVLRYGYVMHETHADRTWTTRKPVISQTGKLLASSLTLSHTIVRKERTRSTPYGFGVDVSGLSPRRWAILGALGMSRSPGTLRND